MPDPYATLQCSVVLRPLSPSRLWSLWGPELSSFSFLHPAHNWCHCCLVCADWMDTRSWMIAHSNGARKRVKWGLWYKVGLTGDTYPSFGDMINTTSELYWSIRHISYLRAYSGASQWILKLISNVENNHSNSEVSIYRIGVFFFCNGKGCKVVGEDSESVRVFGCRNKRKEESSLSGWDLDNRGC